MKLKIKTLNNLEAEVDVKDGSSVEELMKIVETHLPSMPSDRQKLIHSGKVLKRELLLSDYADIKDGDKVIVIAQKQSETTSTVSTQSQKAPVADDRTKAVDVPQPINLAESTLVTGSELEMNIARICEMGFPRAEVEAAMAAAFNNPDRAVEFLTTGTIPDTSMISNSSDAGVYDGGADMLRNIPMSDNLASIQSHPAFQQLRQVIQSDPQVLQRLLENIGETDPELLQKIIEHQDEFMEMLNSSDDMNGFPSADDGPNFVHLTEAEIQSVERLEGLGFSRAAVIEAFLACDKNEELAANYLLENANDFTSDE
ncbi:DNA repair protein Rad23 putatitive [Babesia bovis T2Bo]|uniref:UV excision repair protein RAD23 n=1 Tax=Babesia bovis TaxID=5865 RepID=A7ART9_BABBO|nr:DNA repair protein Rad23 putatitive [Babesia bovis T2Bo]EDO07258.1 DNA repair protein Rad23 putatitive [Babesia bovis T2Bo]|eukprot:XP_001610826.1 DNA repair protein Rad23, putatitve [Babesia bovis T2Bo]